MTATYSVHWRTVEDGTGSQTWRSGLTEAESNTEYQACLEAHPEATQVWIVRSDNTAYRLTQFSV